MPVSLSMRMLALFVGALSFLVGCKPRLSDVELANQQGVLLIGNKVEPQDLDPQVTTGVSEINIHMALFEGLTAPNPVTLAPEPGVAENWIISGDGKTYTFQLRSNARWSNGDPLLASDFVYAWRRMLNPALGARNATMLYPIAGARAYHRGEAPAEALAVHALDDHQLEVRLEHATPHFLYLLMHPAFYPVHPNTLQTFDAFSRRDTSWAHAGNHVGNGPFRLTRWIPNQIVEVERNPHYWDAETVALNGIHFFPIENLGAEENAFLAGQLHVTEALPTSRTPTYIQSGSPYLRIDPYLGVFYLLINTDRTALQDPNVRLALNLAIDRQALIDSLLQGGQLPAHSFTPLGVGDYVPPQLPPFNPGRARELLAQAGYPDGQGFPRVELMFNTSENNRLIAEAVQSMLKRNLGIDILLRNLEYTAYLSARELADFDMARASWIGDYPDPLTFLELWTSDSGNNFSNWSNPEYDSIIKAAAQTTDPVARNQLFFEAESMLLQAAPIIPIYHYVTVYLIHPSVKGWHPTPLDWHPYKHLHLEPLPQGSN